MGHAKSTIFGGVYIRRSNSQSALWLRESIYEVKLLSRCALPEKGTKALSISSSTRSPLYSRVFRRAVPQSLKNFGKSFLKKSFPTVYSRVFWDGLAAHVHSHWGYDEYDFSVVTKCIETVGAESVLDVGCGSGRLFPLFIEQRVEFCGCDISPAAL